MATINLGPCECCGSDCKLQDLGYTEVQATLNANFLFAYPAENPPCGIFNRARFSEVCSSLNGTYVFDLTPTTFSALAANGGTSAYSQYGYSFKHDLTVSVSCTEVTAKVVVFHTPSSPFSGQIAEHVVRYAFYEPAAVPVADTLLAAGKHYYTGVVSVDAVNADEGLYKTVERTRNYSMGTGANTQFFIEAGTCSFLPTALEYESGGVALGPRVLGPGCFPEPPFSYHEALPFDSQVLGLTLQ